MDHNDVAISVNSINKTFKLPHEKRASVKSAFLNILRPKTYELQEALKDINFEIKKGDFFGIVGRNGSGKSTLLKLIAGIYSADSGKIGVHGKLVPFIELGVGFNPELTGRENVFLNGALLGMNRKRMSKLYDEIVQFAELEKFMDQKLSNYSSGMQVRLAFSIAIKAQGDILLLDEVLAVGDVLFQQKCYNYFQQLIKEKKTVVLVSHDTNSLKQFCNKGILIEGGVIVANGSIDEVLDEYVDIVSSKEKKILNRKLVSTQKNHRGTGKVLVKDVKILTNSGKKRNYFTDKDKNIKIRVDFIAEENVTYPVFGITIKDNEGNKVFVTNTFWEDIKTKNLKIKDIQTVNWTIPNIFRTGSYTVTPAVADSSTKEMYDTVDEAHLFDVRKKSITSGILDLEHKTMLE